MSYNLRAYWEEVNHNNVTDRLEIKELNYSGSTLQLTKSQGFTFSHQEITADSNTGYLNPTYNKILMGVLDFTVWGHDTDTKELIEDIKSSESKQFLIEWYNGGQAMWFGFASGRIISKPESEKYLSNIQFRDFEVLKNEFYTKNDSRQKIIQTIADIISELGHNMGTYSGNMLQTFTSWQASGTDVDDDFLNQVYHDTIQLREYGRLGDEEDTDITLFEALKYVCAPQLLIYQMYGAFNVIQLSAFEDPENVLRSDYLLNGTQSNSSIQDLSATIYDTISDGTPIIVQDSENTSYPAIQRVSVDYDHKSLNANINVPKSVQITSPTERKFTMAVRLNGDESIVFSTRNISRVTVPYNLLTTFDENDVSILNDEIEIDQSLSRDERVRFKNTAGSLPGGISEGVTYYAKPIISDSYSFATLPYTVDYIDLTSTGDPSSVTQVLNIEEVTIKTAEFAITLGGTFYDSGVNGFISPGLSYVGMNSILRSFTIADIDTVANEFDITSHGLKDGHLVIFTNTGGSLPGGIDADTYYYVVNSTTNTFQISDTYGGAVKDITSTGSGNHTVNRATAIKNLSNTDSLAQYVGDISFDLDELITDQTVNLNLHLFPTRTLQVGDMDNEYLDETVWEDTILQFVDPSNTSSTSITYRLERDTATGSEILQLAPIRYGDGPFVFSRSAYRTSTNLEDVTTGWRRRGQSTYVDFEKLLLKEVMDTQRGRPSKINANIIGAYNPRTILSYDGKNYAYVGGVYNSRWRPVLVEINIQEDADDILTEIKKVDPSGSGGIIATNPETEGLTETEADARYLQINNNLDDLESASTARTNLGLAIGTDVQAQNELLEDISGLTVGDGTFLVGDGSGDIVAESGNTARTSLGLGTGDSPTFAGLTINGDVTISGTVDGRDVSDDGDDLDELYTTIGLSALTSAEVDQLENIGSVTVSNTQWGYLGALDQNLTTTSDVNFDDATLSGVLRTNEIDAQADLIWSTSTEVFSTSDYYANNAVNIGSNVYITDELDVEEDLRVGGTADISSNTTIGGTLAVSGNSTLSGTLGVTGAVTLNSTVQVDGTATINDDIETADFSSWFTTTPTGWQISQSGVGDFRTLYIDELVAKAFTADVAQALAGTDILTKSVTKLYESFTVPAVSSTVTITVEDLEGLDGLQVFESGDHVRCRVVDSTSGLIILDVYGTVANYSDNTDGTQDWDYTITYAGASNTAVGQTVNKGNILLDYGTSGDYYIERTVLDRSSGTDFSKVPYDRIVQWTNTVSGSPRPGDANTTISVITQSGNLANLTGTYSNVSGFGFFGENTFLTGALLVGDLSKTGNYLEYTGSTLNIVTDTFNLDATTVLLSSSGSGKIALGSDADNILPNDGVGFYADGGGNFLVGSIAQGSDSYISFDGSDLRIKTETFDLTAGSMTIDSSDGITIGANDFFKQDKTFSFGGGILSGTASTVSISGSGATIDVENFDLTASDLLINSGTSTQTAYTPSTDATLLSNGAFTATVTFNDNDLDGTSGTFATIDETVGWEADRLGTSTFVYDGTNDYVLFRIAKTASTNRVRLWQDQETLTSYTGKTLKFTVTVGRPSGDTWVAGDLYLKVYGEINSTLTEIATTIVNYNDLTTGTPDDFDVTAYIRDDYDSIRMAIEYPEQDATTGAPISYHEIQIRNVATYVYDATQVTLNNNGLSVYKSPIQEFTLTADDFALNGIGIKTDDISIPNLIELNRSTSAMRVPDEGYANFAYTEIGGTSRLYVRLSDGTLKYVNLT